MPNLPVIKVLMSELATRDQIARTNEPTLVMADPQQVREYTLAGLEGGVMAPVYLFHCAQLCQVIRPGDRILDLACGPANQLAQIARLNRDCEFVGLDLSPEMLERAREHTASQGLPNVSFVDGSIIDLSQFNDQSFNVVMSTMALHHLPDEVSLKQTLMEAARVLKQDGGIYLADFGRLKRKDSIEYFAHQHEDCQPPCLPWITLIPYTQLFRWKTTRKLAVKFLLSVPEYSVLGASPTWWSLKLRRAERFRKL